MWFHKAPFDPGFMKKAPVLMVHPQIRNQNTLFRHSIKHICLTIYDLVHCYRLHRADLWRQHKWLRWQQKVSTQCHMCGPYQWLQVSLFCLPLFLFLQVWAWLMCTLQQYIRCCLFPLYPVSSFIFLGLVMQPSCFNSDLSHFLVYHIFAIPALFGNRWNRIYVWELHVWFTINIVH